MAMQIQNVTPDITNKRGVISLYSPSQTGGDQINLSFDMNFTGNETLNEAQTMIKARAKQLLQDAIPIL